MAHIGVNYPLAFRRDLASNIERNSASYSRAYYVNLSSCLGTVGSALHGTILHVIESDDLAGNFARWVSPVARIAGRDITAELTIDGSMVGGVIYSTLKIFDRIRGEQVVAGLFGRGAIRYQILAGGCRPGADNDPDLFGVILNTTSASLVSLTWPQYNAL